MTGLPDTREGYNRTFRLSWPTGKEVQVYVTANKLPDGGCGEVILFVGKSGSMSRGALAAWAEAVTIGLQAGVPLQVYIDRFKFWSFDPSGFTGDKEFPRVNSAVDAVIRWLDKKFLKGQTP
jgi:ribonucleoside-diphosphate reductase alpha chain